MSKLQTTQIIWKSGTHEHDFFNKFFFNLMVFIHKYIYRTEVSPPYFDIQDRVEL